MSEYLNEFTSSFLCLGRRGSRRIGNGRKHIPSILRYRKILNHLDDHPEDYGEYFFHKNELSPEDYSWMCINEEEEKRYGFNDKHC